MVTIRHDKFNLDRWNQLYVACSGKSIKKTYYNDDDDDNDDVDYDDDVDHDGDDDDEDDHDHDETDFKIVFKIKILTTILSPI